MYQLPSEKDLLNQWIEYDKARAERCRREARKTIIELAAELGMVNRITDNWNPDGTLKEE